VALRLTTNARVAIVSDSSERKFAFNSFPATLKRLREQIQLGICGGSGIN
jgi:hypothetical protein